MTTPPLSVELAKAILRKAVKARGCDPKFLRYSIRRALEYLATNERRTDHGRRNSIGTDETSRDAG